MHDLEIRGAGEVLGDEQSGEMQQIGFQLYADMLKAAVSALQGRPRARLVAAARRDDRDQPAHVPARLPQDYCNDVHERLVLYKRLASVDSIDELELMQRRARRPLRPYCPSRRRR